MTILTKPSSEKKGDKLITPLVENDQFASAPPTQDDLESQNPAGNILIVQARVRRVSASITLCLLLTALMVVGVGIIGGFHLYNQYLRAQIQKFDFKGWANIPYDEAQTMSLQGDLDVNYPDHMRDSNFDDQEKTQNLEKMLNYFQEGFEINEDNEKIDVPDFRDGRSGRFIHDFNTNITGIIDITGNRCFIMPLNRGNVLPPKSLFDLIHKMWEGYYKVDTQVVRETMRVVLPPITDMKSIGGYIGKECEGRPVYKLEKFVGGVVKRSADLHTNAKFAQFAGAGITEFDIVNFEDIQKFEQQNSLVSSL